MPVKFEVTNENLTVHCYYILKELSLFSFMFERKPDLSIVLEIQFDNLWEIPYHSPTFKKQLKFNSVYHPYLYTLIRRYFTRLKHFLFEPE